jgi:predicted ribosome quality control (RQC) complex YloA/Tae2 family protein
MTEVTLEDVLSDDAPAVTISLDPAQSPNDNIEAYFKRHRKGREGLETLERRRQISEQELVSLREMLADLETDFTSAHERYAADIMALLPAEAGQAEPVVRLPYRVAKLTTGLTVFIGRDGADNDRTTFEFAKPYELWFHTQQCPGSHVVIKYPNKSFEPSKREIEEAAALAAWHSKARNNKLVPVVYTERRYVRKPRKAKPGLVTVEREKSIMVEPRATFE